jgi:hypothetical protein
LTDTDSLFYLTVPTEDIGKPLSQRRYPFRPVHPSQADAATVLRERAEATAAINEALMGIENMVHRFSFRATKKANPEHRQDLVQLALIHLTRCTLPRYDQFRGCKVSTFVFRCLGRHFGTIIRAESRRENSKVLARRPKTLRLSSSTIARTPSRSTDTPTSTFAELVAEQVVTNPELFLSRTQANVLRQLLIDDGKPKKDTAKTLNYKRASSLSMIIRRIKHELREIDVEGIGMELLAKQKSGGIQ